MDEPTDELAEVKEIAAKAVLLRHELHRHPELSGRERHTRELMENALSGVEGVRLERLGGTSLLATVIGKRSGESKTILCRAELDALPITEETGLPWASDNPGVMHACGHDAHMAALYGAILWFSRHRDFAGTIRFLFQESEEGRGGSVDLVDSTLLAGTDESYAFHSMNGPAGKILVPLRYATNGVAMFRIVVHGKSTHGSLPHMGIDPIRILAAIVSQLYALPSNVVNPSHRVSLTFGSLSSGSVPNQIPDEAVGTGSIRAQSAADLKSVCQAASRIVVSSAHGYGAEAEFEYGGADPIHNDSAIASDLLSVLRDRLGEDWVGPAESTNFSDDFSVFSERFPGAYMLFGAGNDQEGMRLPNHSSGYYVLDKAISMVIRAWIVIIEERLRA